MEIGPMKAQSPPDAEYRFLLFHLQPISSRLLFLRHVSGSVLTPRPLPFLSSPIEDDVPVQNLGLMHQLTLGMQLNANLGFEPGMLVVEQQFLRQAEIPRAVVDVYLARFTTLDPSHAELKTKGGRFCPITELQGGHPVEMAMLRWA